MVRLLNKSKPGCIGKFIVITKNCNTLTFAATPQLNIARVAVSLQ